MHTDTHTDTQCNTYYPQQGQAVLIFVVTHVSLISTSGTRAIQLIIFSTCFNNKCPAWLTWLGPVTLQLLCSLIYASLTYRGGDPFDYMVAWLWDSIAQCILQK